MMMALGSSKLVKLMPSQMECHKNGLCLNGSPTGTEVRFTCAKTNVVPDCLQSAWPAETWRYAQRIRHILAKMSKAQTCVRPENVEPVQNYLNVLAFAEIQSIIDVVQPREPEPEPELQWLVESYRGETEKDIKGTLEKAQYYIDAPESIPLLFGAGRIEKVRR
jgi:hypothetical protein